MSQNVWSLSTRRFGGLPAIKAELMPPIEIPTTQSGRNPDSAKASYAPPGRPQVHYHPARAESLDQIQDGSYHQPLTAAP